MDLVPIWKDAQARVIELSKEASPADAAKTVPTCPSWTVHDLVAHMVGVDADVVSETAPANPTDDWTAGHVAKRGDLTLLEILTEWQDLADEVLETLTSGPSEAKSTLIADISTHEQDLRGALGKPGFRDQPGMQLSLQGFLDMFGDKITEAELPSVHVIAGALETTVGKGMAEVTLTADPFELHRALTGRRSAAQVRKLGWAGDPEPYLPLLSFTGEHRSSDLEE